MGKWEGTTAVDAGYPVPGVSYVRPTGKVMAPWGDGSRVPPKNQRKRLAPFTFWDGTALPGGFHKDAMPALEALDAILKRHNYRLGDSKDDWAFNRRKMRGGNSWSSHSWGCAIDLNAQTNPFIKRFLSDMPPPMVADIEALRTGNDVPVWRWGGRFRYRKANGDVRGTADAMHWQIACSPRDLASGIKRSGTPPSVPVTVDTDNDMSALANATMGRVRRIFTEEAGRGEIDEAGELYWAKQCDVFTSKSGIDGAKVVLAAVRYQLGVSDG